MSGRLVPQKKFLRFLFSCPRNNKRVSFYAFQGCSVKKSFWNSFLFFSILLKVKRKGRILIIFFLTLWTINQKLFKSFINTKHIFLVHNIWLNNKIIFIWYIGWFQDEIIFCNGIKVNDEENIYNWNCNKLHNSIIELN